MTLPSETRTFNTLFSLTWDAYAGNAARNMLTSFPLIDLMWRNKQVKTGGARIEVSLDYGYNPNGQWYNGADILDMNPFETSTVLKYDWKNLHFPIAYTGEEVRKNNAEYQRKDLVRTKIETTEVTIRKVLELAMVGDGLGNQGKVILGLEAMFPTDPTIDPGVGAVGGLTAVGNAFWQNYAVTSFGSFAANGPGGTAADALLDAWDTISDGSDTPDMILSSQDVYQFYHRAAVDQAQIIMSQNATGTLTFRSMMYNGVPWTWSRTLPNGRLYLLRTKDMQFWVHSQANMTLGEFQKSYNQDAFAASILTMCAFIPTRRMFTAVIDGITA